MENNKKILLISIGFPPNTGGVETHLWDYVNYLSDKNYSVDVITYQPIVTKTSGKSKEIYRSATIKRINWIGKGWFLKFKNNPTVEFLYLFPPLVIVGIYKMLREKNYYCIHAHGLIAGSAAVTMGKIFKKKVIISTHSLYTFPDTGIYRNFSKLIFYSAHKILALSRISKNELVELGIPKEKISIFTSWVNQTIFKPRNKDSAKKKFGLKKKFNVLYVGRLVEEKGIFELIDAINITNKQIQWLIVGDGPLEITVKRAASKYKNLSYLGTITNQELPIVYNASDIVIVPSTHEEGFGRVIAEALSCGVPVIASNTGGIPEVMDESVGKLISVTPSGIKKSVEELYYDKNLLKKKAKNATIYAKKHYSSRNAKIIINAYK